MRPKRLYVETLGCPKNITRSQDFFRNLDLSKFEVVYSPDQADAIILNTCGFIADAVKESVERSLELRAMYPDKRIIFAGCIPLRYGKEQVAAELPEVDEVAPGMSLPNMLSEQASNEGSSILTYPYAYVSLGEGCNGRCSYCTIPKFWGPFRSRREADIVSELNSLSEAGIKEAILVSQDSGAWGVDLYGRPSLSKLIEALRDVDIPWIRVMYLNPTYVSEGLLKAWSSVPNVLPYFDLPLQSGSDRILRLMKRGYNAKKVVHAARLIDEVFANAVKRTSIIVGFPTETEEDVSATAQILQEANFQHVGVFLYSDEEGTESYNLRPKVPKRTAKRWLRQIENLSAQLDALWRESLVGSKVTCLVEAASDGAFVGRVWGDAPEVDGVFVGSGEAEPGELIEVVIEKTESGKLVGHKEG
ncbi:MiaB/RimO family radical SAM methylthiotransferase [Coprothermobacteraceae bacterium]|nr:MiaB/RimO family radical SAM methylthiotransferase [Coprothermobacteraceae bacterium]